MEKEKVIDILKQAILLEKRGKAFYANIAAQTKSEAVKRVFSMMSEEEDQHIAFLSKQYRSFMENNSFTQNTAPEEDPNEEVVMGVLTKEMKNQITAASFEAAAISAAMDFETRAVKLYSDRAESATDPLEKETYQMLADWEKGHHKWLMQMDKELKEEVWDDNNFWPF